MQQYPNHQTHNMSIAPTTSGFIAGTLVHARDGLLPINTLRPGDEVLVQLDPGAQVYRPVSSVQTAESEICLVELIPASDLDVARAAKTMVSNTSVFRFLMAKRQPLLIEGVGWVCADELMAWKQGMPLLPTQDGRGVAAAGSFGGIRRQVRDEGWFQYVAGADTGFVLNCRDGGALELMQEHQSDVISDIAEWWEPENALRCKVFTLLFEQPAIYFVGSIGVAVHSADPPSGRGREALA